MSWKPTRRWMGAGHPVASDRKVRMVFDFLSAAMTTSHLEYQLGLAESPSAIQTLGHEKGDAYEVAVAHEWARLVNTHSEFDGFVARREVKYRRGDSNEVVRVDLVVEAKGNEDPAQPLLVAELKVGKDRNWTPQQLAGDAQKMENLVLDNVEKAEVMSRKFVTVVVTPAKKVGTLQDLRRLAQDPSLQWPDIPARRTRNQSVREGWQPRILAMFPRYTPAPSAPSAWGRHEWTVSALIAYEQRTL